MTTKIVKLVTQDLMERRDVGIAKYGLPLTVGKPCHNGKSALQNAYEEALDLSKYLKKAMLEGESVSEDTEIVLLVIRDLEEPFETFWGPIIYPYRLILSIIMQLKTMLEANEISINPQD